jgi:hypothetical protein
MTMADDVARDDRRTALRKAWGSLCGVVIAAKGAIDSIEHARDVTNDDEEARRLVTLAAGAASIANDRLEKAISELLAAHEAIK